MTKHFLASAAIFAAFVLSCGIAARASDTITIELDAKVSSSDGVLEVIVQAPGSLIGDYDEVGNPAGTLTRPGLFGGSGNQNVPIDLTNNLNGLVQSQPSGGYQLGLDVAESVVSMTDFQVDLLGGKVGSLDLTIDLIFETFRTFQPDSVFPGVPLSVPIGQGSLSVFNLQQTPGTVASDLLEIGPGNYTFDLEIPVLATIEAELLGQIISPGPIPIVLSVAGNVMVVSDQVTVTQSISQLISNEVADVPGGEFTDLPFPVPTVLPPGQTANLLISGVVDSFAIELDLDASLVGTGQIAAILPGDLNGDGNINLLDVSPFIAALTSGTYVAAADFNCDGDLNLLDVAPFIAAILG